MVTKKITANGAWVALSVELPTPGFGSCCELRVMRSKAHVRLCAQSAGKSAFPSPSASASPTVVPALSQIKK